MKNLRLQLALLLSLAAAPAAVAARLTIDVRPNFAGQPLALHDGRCENSAGEKLSFTRLSYLLSGFALERADGSWLEFTNRFAWLDAERGRDSFQLDNIPAENFRSVRFFVGLDEPVNTNNPARYPDDHPLNPNLNGLHWSWQGGYIFLAVEGMWRTNDSAPLGFSYHFARSPNRTRISLNAQLNLTNDLALKLDFDLATLLNAPRPLSFARDGNATHSHTNDPVAAALAANLPGAFRVRKIETVAPEAQAVAAVKPPLFLPEKYTPFPFQMSAYFPIPDLPRDNPLLVERVTLGEKLFHETALSKDGTLACASCHRSGSAFADPRQYSVGVRAQAGTRHAMPLFNLAWKISFFWDGR